MARASGAATARDCLAEQLVSQVPIQIDLATSEVVDSSSNAPPALYVLGPRAAYLPGLGAQALASFQHVLLPTTDRRDPWFEYQHVPLKWQYPIGVLFDLHAPGEHMWRLTVHFRDFPADHLMQYDGEESMQMHFFMSLKEAAFICLRSSQIVQNMTAAAHADLWRSVMKADAAKLLAMQEHLLRELVPKRDRIPVRVLVTGQQLEDRACYTSRPCAAKREDGSVPSLGETLRELLPGLLAVSSSAGAPSRTTSVAEGQLHRLSSDSEPPSPSTQPSGLSLGEAASLPSALPAEGSAAAQPETLSDDQLRAIVGGVEAPLDTPLPWLHAAMHHPDQFVYVVVHVS